MKKIFGTVLAAGLLLAPAFADTVAPRDWVGVIDGQSSYQVVQVSTGMLAENGKTSRVHVGDRVVSAANPVTMRMAENSTVLVGANSTVEVAAERVVALRNGSVAAGFQTVKPVAVRFATLEMSMVQPQSDEKLVPTAGASKSAVFSIEQLKPNTIRLSALNQMAVVKDIASGAQLAVVGANDTLELVQNSAGNWVTNTRSVFQPLMQDGGAPPPDTTSTEFAGGGGAGGGGGGFGGGLAGGLAGLGGGLAAAAYVHNNAQNDQNRLENRINDLEDNQQSPNSP